MSFPAPGNTTELTPINRTNHKGWPRVAGAAGAVAGATALYWGISEFWHRNPAKAAEEIGVFIAGYSAIRLGISHVPLDSDSKFINKSISARPKLWAGVVGGVIVFGTAFAIDHKGHNTAPITVVPAATAAPGNTEPVTVSVTEGSDATIIAAAIANAPFAYNHGNPIPPGNCTVPAPISGHSPEIVAGVRHFEELLQAAGYEPGAIDGKSDTQLSTAVDKMQETFGMSHEEAISQNTKWKLEDCYEASQAIPALSALWQPA